MSRLIPATFNQPRYAEALEARERAIRSIKDLSVIEELLLALKKYEEATEDQAAAQIILTGESLKRAEVFYLSDPILRLLEIPARAWDGSWTTEVKNYPSPHGFVFLQTPIKSTAIEPLTGKTVPEAWTHAFSWGMFGQSYQDDPLEGIITSFWAGQEVPSPHSLWMPTVHLSYLNYEFKTSRKSNADSMRYLGGMLVSFLVFVMQKIIEPEVQVPDRASRRRLERDSASSPRASRTIQVIRLRKKHQEHKRESLQEEEARINWTCSWMVRGHWRTYTGKGGRKPQTIWISPYLKGDPEKPLKLGAEKVFAVIR